MQYNYGHLLFSIILLGFMAQYVCTVKRTRILAPGKVQTHDPLFKSLPCNLEILCMYFQYNTLFPYSVAKAACDQMTKALALGKDRNKEV